VLSIRYEDNEALVDTEAPESIRLRLAEFRTYA
jgi:hypothetical protein